MSVTTDKLFLAAVDHHYAKGNYDHALDLAEKGLQTNPSDQNIVWRFQERIVNCYYKMKRMDLAIVAAQNGLIDAEDKNIGAKLHLHLSSCYNRLKNNSSAITEALEGLKLEPDEEDLALRLNISLARGYMLSRESEKAIFIAKRELEANPNSKYLSPLHLTLAICYNHRGQFESSNYHAREGMQANPSASDKEAFENLLAKRTIIR